MKRFEAIAAILILVALVFFVFYLRPAISPVYEEKFLSEDLTPSDFSSIKNPIQWIKEISQKTAENIPFLKEEIENKYSINDSTDFFQPVDLSKKTENKNSGFAASDYSAAAEYYKKFAEIAVKTNFTQEEISLMKKNSGGNLLSLEELIELAANGTNQAELKPSFGAWRDFDERLIAEFKKISTDFYFNQSLLNWFEYHFQTAEKFNKENLSISEIKNLESEFKSRAASHNSSFGKSVSGLDKSPDFTLAPAAQAITCGAITPPFYHFGGRVVYLQGCDWGAVTTVTPPCGGLFLFTWATIIANPYNWHYFAPPAVILGKSLIYPGCCCIALCVATCVPYETIVVYFGSSLVF